MLLANWNDNIRRQTAKKRLIDIYGNITVTLSTANTISHDKTPMKLRCDAGRLPHTRGMMLQHIGPRLPSHSRIGIPTVSP